MAEIAEIFICSANIGECAAFLRFLLFLRDLK